jgi:hypothetical protein
MAAASFLGKKIQRTARAEGNARRFGIILTLSLITQYIIDNFKV